MNEIHGVMLTLIQIVKMMEGCMIGRLQNKHVRIYEVTGICHLILIGKHWKAVYDVLILQIQDLGVTDYDGIALLQRRKCDDYCLFFQVTGTTTSVSTIRAPTVTGGLLQRAVLRLRGPAYWVPAVPM